MKNKKGLSDILYNTQEEFYHEDMIYRNFNKDYVKSNKIKKHLNEILTHAIFEYRPCKDLLQMYKKKKPTAQEWITNTENTYWLTLSVDPYHIVSDHVVESFYCDFHLT